MTHDEWEAGLPAAITGDRLWTVEAYRLSLFLADLAWEDAGKLLADRRGRGIADQLVRACGRVGANIAEGYSRSSYKARVVYYEYALGSTREARDWYYKSRHVIGPDALTHRLALVTTVIRLTVTMIGNERRAKRALPPRRASGTE